MKKVKNILIDLQIEGQGIVNMDSNDQKWVYNAETQHTKKGRYDNILYGKKNFYRGDKGELIEKLKISRDCMLKAAFEDDYIASSPNIVHHDMLLYSYIGSVPSLLRGYLFADKKETLKRKGAITLCDAEQTNNAIATLETCSKAEFKEGTEEGDRAAANYFISEKVGEVTYATKGYIDLAALQFVSCDQTLDRYSFNPDKFGVYKQFLQNSLPDKELSLAYYQFATSNVLIPELGMKLSDQNVVFLTKQLLERLLLMNVRRAKSYAKTAVLRIKLVEDPFTDTFGSESNWITITNKNDIDTLDFSVHSFYDVVDPEKVKKEKAEIDNKVAQAKEDNKTAKANKKEKGKKKDVELVTAESNANETH
jgi:hypothetical protein